jgi:hypothetical protein
MADLRQRPRLREGLGRRPRQAAILGARLALPFALLLAMPLLLAACNSRAPAGAPPRRAFYLWRTTFALSAAEQRALADTGATRLYLRVFDVEWRTDVDGPATMGPVTAPAPAASQLPAGTEVVPVVFLRNDVFTRLPAARVAEVARWTWQEVAGRAAVLGVTPRELQLDCDWTDSTRERYFAFLAELTTVAAAADVTLSATIRLHQVKYRERTGVPPVSRGMLMFYNMGTFSPDPEARAIFDERSARRYLARVGDYPLPLDVALPIWSWVIHLRDRVVEGLLQSTDPDELARLDFVTAAGADRYQVSRTAFLHGTLLRAGDVLKIEVTGPGETLTAARMLAPRLAPARSPRTVALFDLSERNLRRHGTDDLDLVFRALR